MRHREGHLGFAEIKPTKKPVQKPTTPSQQVGSQAAFKNSIPNWFVCGTKSWEYRGVPRSPGDICVYSFACMLSAFHSIPNKCFP